MTPQFLKTVNQALALVAIGCGGFGMMLCVPYLMSVHWVVIQASAVVFLSGAVLYAAGAVCMAILINKDVSRPPTITME